MFNKINDPAINQLVEAEKERQTDELELIASENYASPSVLAALATPLANKYSEGYIGKRYYGGNEIIDQVEALAIDRAKQLFGAEHVNIQPLSGSPANLAVYLALLEPGDTVLGLRLDHGGHLSHGHPINISGRLFKFVQYEVDPITGRLNMDQVREIARLAKPKLIVAGFSAYSREIDWNNFQNIANEVGALTMADISHTAGLIAGQQLTNPTNIFDVITTTTHKTLRGPRGAMIMCKEKLAKDIDRAVFPGLQGGPHDHVTAAKAIAFAEALQPEFKNYARQVIVNAQLLASELINKGYNIVSGGTDTHLLVVDLTKQNLAGRQAEEALQLAGLSVSRSTVPGDLRPPLNPSGIRIGTAAITTRGFKEAEIKQVATWLDLAIKNHDQKEQLILIKQQVTALGRRLPPPGL
ncbi:MAG TPA: serine hydroxymethyltransferase [bacterium]|nr:serine hydroxymethyltransferase [bacterium]